MDTEYDRSRIEQLKRGLYKPGEDGTPTKSIPSLSKSRIDVESDWEDTSLGHPTHGVAYQISTGLIKKIVLVALLAVLGSGGYLLYTYFDPVQPIDEKNIVITLSTPVAVTPGVPADIVVRVDNQNRVALEYSDLTVIFPSGSRDSESTDRDLKEKKESLGRVESGEVVEFKTKAILLGEEGEEKRIVAKLEYRFEDMNSTFSKEAERPIRLRATPVNLTVDMLKEINAGQEIAITVNANSNTTIQLRDMLVKIEYPVGFNFVQADPKPTFGNNIWRIGDLAPSSKFAIKVRGTLDAVETDRRIFRTLVGVSGDKTERDISTTYSKIVSELTVKKPFIGIALSINDKPAGDALAHYGAKATGLIKWRNNLPVRVTNAQIEVKLSGVALNRASVVASNGGFYRSVDDAIYWDERGNPDLAELEAGEDGIVSFQFEPLPPVSNNELIVNPVITAEVTVRGKRMSDANVPEEIKTVMAQNVRVASEAQFVARALYYSGPFKNTGPMPPRVEQETTYTIIWTIVNTSNTIAGARVRGVLPPYMQWFGSVFPPKEKITYNPVTNEILWEPGDIPAGTGIGGTPPKEVAFQLVLTPSLSQLKKEPVFILNQLFTAIDTFTNSEVSIKGRNMTTFLVSDPFAGDNTRAVVE